MKQNQESVSCVDKFTAAAYDQTQSDEKVRELFLQCEIATMDSPEKLKEILTVLRDARPELGDLYRRLQEKIHQFG